MRRCTQDIFTFLCVHTLEEKVRAMSNNRGSVVVTAECCKSRRLGSITAGEVSTFKFFPEQKKRLGKKSKRFLQ